MEYVGVKKKQGSIVELLKDEILSGNIPEGTELTQNELADSLGVSRMPVREALIILEYQGLIERLKNNHVRVAEFSEDYFGEIFKLCRQMEEEALFALPDLDILPAKEQAFHECLCHSLSHSFLKKTLETMIEIYVAFGLQCRAYDFQKGGKLIRDMTEALKAGDKSKGRELLRAYFEALTEAVMKERRS